MKTKLAYGITTVLMIGLTACGGGSSSDTPVGGSNTTGYVGDGYIEGAYVCHDSNANLDCLDETYATTLADGSFSLSGYDPSQDLLVQVPVGALDNGPFSNGITTPRPFTAMTWYYYPAGAAPASDPIFVGPLSTLIYAQQQQLSGITIDDATSIVAASLGVTTTQLTGNYLEDNTAEGDSTQFIAEIVGGSIANTANNAGSYGADIQTVLVDLGNVATTATTSDPLTYNPGQYSPSVAAVTANGLVFTPVSDVCGDLSLSKYYAFEEWASASDQQEHKALFTASAGSNEILHLKVDYLGGTSSWNLDTEQSSTSTAYASFATLVDMQNVNASGDIGPLKIFGSTRVSCNGSNALFNASGFSYKLVVSEADISGVTGVNLPQGATVGNIVDAITFGTGDKMYHAAIIIQDDEYVVDKTSGSDPQNYTVYEEGTLSGPTFPLMLNSNDINQLAQLIDTDFIVNYTDSSTYDQIAVTTITAMGNGNTNTVTATKFVNGQAHPSRTLPFSVEMHNGTPFFVVHGFSTDSTATGLFIGKISSVDATNLVYGEVTRANAVVNLTQGGYQVDGDFMDDIMVNTSARDLILSTNVYPVAP